MTRGKRIGAIVLGIAAVLLVGMWIASIVLRPTFPSPESITARMRQQSALTGGAQVYATHCAYCHDTGYGPAIAGKGLTVEVIRTFVRSGPGAMQAFTPAQVSDPDIDAVARYVNAASPVVAKTP